MKVSVLLDVPESCGDCLFSKTCTKSNIWAWDCDYDIGETYYCCGLNPGKEVDEWLNLDTLRLNNPKCPFAKHMPAVCIDKNGHVIHKEDI